MSKLHLTCHKTYIYIYTNYATKVVLLIDDACIPNLILQNSVIYINIDEYHRYIMPNSIKYSTHVNPYIKKNIKYTEISLNTNLIENIIFAHTVSMAYEKNINKFFLFDNMIKLYIGDQDGCIIYKLLYLFKNIKQIHIKINCFVRINNGIILPRNIKKITFLIQQYVKTNLKHCFVYLLNFTLSCDTINELNYFLPKYLYMLSLNNYQIFTFGYEFNDVSLFKYICNLNIANKNNNGKQNKYCEHLCMNKYLKNINYIDYSSFQ